MDLTDPPGARLARAGATIPAPGVSDAHRLRRRDQVFSRPEVSGKLVRGGAISLATQIARFVLQTGSVAVMARLLLPTDFGLQGMVLAITGVLSLFGDVGLGAATIQRAEITHEQLSTVFWINMLVGAALAVLTAALAPALAAFYHEPRLVAITLVSALGFLIVGASAQHMAILQRHMCYSKMAVIDLSSLAAGMTLGIVMGTLGFGYWSLVAASACNSVTRGIVLWCSVPWTPGLPVRGCGIRSMLHFGGTVTFNNFVVYLSYNLEKVLLGRFWGAETLGLYGRAYQLVNLPLEQLHASMYKVGFPALSRLQHGAGRLRRAFLKGYSVLLSLTVPLTLFSAVFASEIVRILLGAKWSDAVPVLRLLSPSILVFGMINPFGWLMQATGRTTRSLYIAYLIAPVVILGILVGLSHGPKGVACGYSAALTLLWIPVVVWARHDSGITMMDYWATVRGPLLSGLLAGGIGLVFESSVPSWSAPARLATGGALVGATYVLCLLFVMRQKDLYVEFFGQLTQRRGMRAA